MKKQILFILCFLCSVTIFARTSTIVDKETFKELKNRYKNNGYVSKAKSISLEHEDDGFEYYKIIDKKNYVLALLDNHKELLLTLDYAKVLYVPYLEAGWKSINYPISDDYQIWIQSSPACFYVDGLYDCGVYNLDGTPRVGPFNISNTHALAQLCGFPDKDKPYYFEVCLTSTKDFKDKKKALFSINGEELYPFDKQDFKALDYNRRIPFIIQKKEENGHSCKGGRFLNDSLHHQYGIVPCVFYDLTISRKEDVLYYKMNDFDNEKKYEPTISYNETPRDSGELYYKHQNYDKVIEFYSTDGVSQPWAKFFSGVAWYQKGHSIYHDASLFAFTYHRFGSQTAIAYYGQKVYDLELAKNEISMAKTLFEQYILESDEEFSPEAKRLIYTCTEELQKIPSIQNDLNAIKQIQNAEQEARRQQQAAFWGAFLQSFANSLGNAIEQSVSTPTTTSTYPSYSAPASSSYSSPSSSHSSSSSSESSTSSTPSQVAHKCDRCHGTGKILRTSTVATYGNDKRVVCPVCHQEHWASTVHHHEKCSTCNGTGTVYR